MFAGVFMDRDGTINVEKKYLYKISDWEWIPKAKKSIKLLKENNFKIIIISNQSGISRGLFSEKDLYILNNFINSELYKINTKIDAFYHCPHHPSFNIKCDCRKPGSGLIKKAAKELNIDLNRSWMIGDKKIDIMAGQDLGIKTILVRTGYGKKEEKKISIEQIVLPSIYESAKFILAQ